MCERLNVRPTKSTGSDLTEFEGYYEYIGQTKDTKVDQISMAVYMTMRMMNDRVGLLVNCKGNFWTGVVNIDFARIVTHYIRCLL